MIPVVIAIARMIAQWAVEDGLALILEAFKNWHKGHPWPIVRWFVGLSHAKKKRKRKRS